MRKKTMGRAVVIGAASGMGSAVAARLHEDGYELMLADLSIERLEALASRLAAKTIAVDITNDDTLNKLAEHCQATGIDALVITAGLSASMASFERIMEVNLAGTARALRKLGTIMNKGGVAVCFSSMAAHLSGPVNQQVEPILADASSPDLVQKLLHALDANMRVPGMAYALSKVGVIKLVEKTSVPWGKMGARICSISPGLIDTPMGNLEIEATAGADAAIKLVPIPRLGAPEEVANVVSFLCSQQASYVTGCDILVDGGWVGAIRSSADDSPIAKALATGGGKLKNQ